MDIKFAYNAVMRQVIELAKTMPVKIKPSRSRQNKDTVEKYNIEGRIKPDDWVHISFLVDTSIGSDRVFDAKMNLGKQGIHFDAGAGGGEIDWEIDWSLHVGEPSIEATQELKNLLDNTDFLSE